MPAKYNRFLMTTCLSVIAFTLTAPTNAYAGFEWTPPEKKEEVIAPVYQPDVPTSNAEEMDIDTSVTEDAMPEPEMDMAPIEEVPEVFTETAPEENSAPIEIRVLEDEVFSAEETQSTPEDIVEMTPVVEDEPVNLMPSPVEAKIEVEAQTEGEIEIIEEPEVIAEPEPEVEIIAEPDVEPTTTEVISQDDAADEPSVIVHSDEIDAPFDAKESEASDALTINPFPVEDMGANQDQNEKAVFLPNDEDMDLDDISSNDVIEEKEETQDAALKEEIFWNEPPSFNIIEGFGSDMPLALVLTQVVPAQYAFSFGEGVNPGAILSWEGGEPWNIVLENALKPLGYTFSINGKKLSIKNSTMKTESSEQTETQTEEETIVIDETASEEEAPVEHEQVEITSQQPEPVLNAPEEDENIAVEDEDQNPEMAEDNQNSAPVKRGAILDPGMEEAKQPEANMLSDEKKNLEQTEASDSLSVDPETAIFSHKEAETVEDLTEDTQDGKAPEEALHLTSDDFLRADETANGATIVTEGESTDAPFKHPQDEETKELTVIEIPALDEAQPLLNEGGLNEDNAANDVLNEDPSAKFPQAEEPLIEAEKPTQDVDSIIPVNAEPSPEPADVQKTVSDPVDLKAIEGNAKPKASPSNKNITWQGKKGRDLYTILSQWSEEENIELVWTLDEKDIELSSNIFINGTFKNAVDVLLSKGVKNAPQYAITLDPYQLTIK